MQGPKTLMEAIKFFSEGDNALNYLANIRWPKGVVCPYCGDKGATLLKTRKIWKCKTKDCRKQFSTKVGTIFEDSPIKLDKWIPPSGCSPTARTASVVRIGPRPWRDSKVRLVHAPPFPPGHPGKPEGNWQVEADESFIGGKARNMHASKRKQRIHGGGPEGKAIVMGLLERHGKVGTAVVETSETRSAGRGPPARRARLGPVHRRAAQLRRLKSEYAHNVINHAEEYVNGNVHTTAWRTSGACSSAALEELT